MQIPPIKCEDLPANKLIENIIEGTAVDKDLTTVKTEITKAYKNTITNITTNVESASQLINAHYHYSTNPLLTVLKDFNLNLNIRENPIGAITTKGEVKVEIGDLAKKEIFVSIVENEIHSFVDNLTEVAQGTYNSLQFQGIYDPTKVATDIKNAVFKRLQTLNLDKGKKVLVNVEELEDSVIVQNGQAYVEIMDNVIIVLICSSTHSAAALMNGIKKHQNTQTIIKELNQSTLETTDQPKVFKSSIKVDHCEEDKVDIAAKEVRLARLLETVKQKVKSSYLEIMSAGSIVDEDFLFRGINAAIHQEMFSLVHYTNACKGIHFEYHEGKLPTKPAVIITIDKEGVLGIEVVQQKEPDVENSKLYAWTGNVFDYLDLYKEDVMKALGVDDIRLYPKGIREAVGVCFTAADKYEDKHRASGFKGYVMHKVLAHLEDLDKKVKVGEQFFAGIEKATEDLSNLGKQWRVSEVPAGFVDTENNTPT